MARRAFVALVASAGVLATVVGAGTVLGANEDATHALGPIDPRPTGAISANWLLSPGSILLLSAAGFVLLRGRKP